MATLYHNPRCGKSREALRLLEARGIKPVIVEYLKTPPSATELKRILKLLGMKARGLLRSKEPAYKQAGLDDQSLDEDKIVAAMIAHPILIERPILLANGKAALGRPPENILRIL